MKTILMIRQILSPKYKFAALLLLLAMIISALLEILSLAILMPMVSAFIKPELFQSNKYFKTAFDLSGADSPHNFIIIAAISIVILYIVKNIYNFVVFYAQSYYTVKLSLNITNRIYKKVLDKPYQYFISINNTDIANKIMRITEFGNNFLLPLFIMVTEMIVFTVLVLTILIIYPLIALAAFAVSFTVIGGFYFILHKKIVNCGKSEHQARNELMLLLTQTLASVKEMKFANAQELFRRKICDAQEKNLSAVKKISDWGSIPRLLLETMTIIITMSILLVLLANRIDNEQIIFMAAFFLGVMFRLLPSISRMQHNMHWVKHHFYLFKLIHESLSENTESDEENTGDEDFTFNNSISFKQISFSYPANDGKKVFCDFDLELKPYESVVFTGVSGCGKTTLIDLLSGLLAPQQGVIEIDGKPMQKILKKWQNSIGYVPQETILFNSSLKENIALGIPADKIDDERIRQVIELAQLDSFTDSLPEKENTLIGGENIRLSGGQKQRIAIARALYKNPSLLILDEATSALDNETESAFADVIISLKKQLTVIMIAHREKMVDICDRHISL